MARFSCSGFLVLAALLFSIEVNAGRVVVPEPGSIVPTFTPGTGPSAFIDSRSWDATISTQGGSRVKVPVTASRSYGWPKWASGAKSLIKNSPAQAAAAAGLGGILAAVDWVMKDGALVRWPDATSCFHAYYGGTGMATRCEYSSGGDACRGLYEMSGVNYRSAGALQGGVCYYYPVPSGTVIQSGRWESLEIDPSTQPRVPVVDSDIDSLVDGINDPVVAADSAPFIADNIPGSFDYPDGYDFTGPPSIDLPSTTTTTTNPTTGDTTVVESLPSIQFEYGTQPWSITPTDKTTTNTYKNGTKTETSETVTSPVTVGSGGAVQVPPVEVPTDCAFMPTVCEFIEWVKQPFEEEEPDLSELISDDDFTKSVTFSGNATCPAPTVINTQFGAQVFDWTPGCEWAAMLKPLIILGALLAALYISLGIGRSD